MLSARSGWKCIVCLCFALSAGALQASSLSFLGTFTQDDQQLLITLIAPSNSVVIRTFGYAGGTNGAGALIPAGGFDPVLSLFDSTGGLTALSPLVAFTDSTGCGPVPADPATGACFDEELTLTTLLPGNTYTLVLTQSNNYPNGGFFGDGFTQDGAGNFTPGEFGCSASAFCDSNLPSSGRTGNWAVDISGVRDAVGPAAGTPEPSTLSLMILCLAGGLPAWQYRRSRIAPIEIRANLLSNPGEDRP